MKYKFTQFLNFVQEYGQVYLQREAFVAFEYFKDRRRVPILEKINKGGISKHLLNKIDNIAWDFTAPRFLENMFLVQGQGDCFIPFFLSFDSKLRELIKMMPIKAVIIDSNSGHVHSVTNLNIEEYFKRNGCELIVSEFFSPEKTLERYSRITNDDKKILSLIRTEYKQLRYALLG